MKRPKPDPLFQWKVDVLCGTETALANATLKLLRRGRRRRAKGRRR